MADYNLSALNPRDFQHLIQAISRRAISKGVSALGDGLDGARDLFYQGKMDFPTDIEKWEGYLIIGCKFKQNELGDNKRNTDWAIQQLKKDLNKFSNRKRKLTKPDYYIFATNINLTAIYKTGGRDKVDFLLKDFSKKLKLKGTFIWDYNDIRGFIDNYNDIRMAYGHFITAGDVLVQMMECMKPTQNNFFDIMHLFLQKEMLSDMSAKLQSAGEDPDFQIPLSNVFVDLPFSLKAVDATYFENKEDKKSSMSIEFLLKEGSRVLRKGTNDDESKINLQELDFQSNYDKYVIVGGPGQGKSTLAQYLCQIYRAAILKDRPRGLLDEKIPRIIKQIENNSLSSFGLPKARRFPIRIELKNYAQMLNNNINLSLMEYIRKDISNLGNTNINIDDLKKWLNLYPWLLILDGLDEVPPSSNRSDVIKQIDYFIIDAVSLNADLMIIVTTRPQSYNKEFSVELFKHLYLSPLLPNYALEYGKRLAQARCGHDTRRYQDLIRSLDKACKNIATARLMQSPLQVTIMATLLEETGEPPQQRYRLFLEYYRTIYKRETRRRLLGGILSERQTDIDTIHWNAGLFLHAKSENIQVSNTKENTEDALTDEQFKEIVSRRLKQIEVPDQRAKELVSQIADSSLQRLVFLARHKEGWIRFDISSLKEFMAAEAIMNGSDEDIRQRIKAISPNSYWRNVLLFAIGKCFVAREHLLDNIINICNSLNDERLARDIFGNESISFASKTILCGSRLALDILEDGTAKQFPNIESHLTKIALELLKLNDIDFSARLASVYHSDLKGIYYECITDKLNLSDFWMKIGAWHTLIYLANRNVEWTFDLIDSKWPTESSNLESFIYFHGESWSNEWLSKKIVMALPGLKLSHFIIRADTKIKNFPEPWHSLLHIFMNYPLESTRVKNNSSFVLVDTFFMVPLKSYQKNDWKAIKNLDPKNELFIYYISASRFIENPSASTLAGELKYLSSFFNSKLAVNKWQLPWPILACLNFVSKGEELIELSNKVIKKELGDIDDWIKAEERWLEFGITDQDIAWVNKKRSLPFDKDIREIGMPISIFIPSFDLFEISKNKVNSLINAINSYDSKFVKHLLSYWLFHMSNIYFKSRPNTLTIDQIKQIYSFVESDKYSFEKSFLLNLIPKNIDDDWVDLLNWLGKKGIRFIIPSDEEMLIAEKITLSFITNPLKNIGLIPLLLELFVAGYNMEVPKAVIESCISNASSFKLELYLLKLSCANLSQAEIKEIADEINSSSKNLWFIDDLIKRIMPDYAFTLIEMLLRGFHFDNEDKFKFYFLLLELIVELLNKLPSKLREEDIWRALKLPNRL